MNKKDLHTFHIPVMGLGYTVDTPIKVARFGISSVISIIEDKLMEKMREYYFKKEGEEYVEILESDLDHRALRVKGYLDLVKRIVDQQISKLKNEPFEKGNDIMSYFELLPEHSALKKMFNEMLQLEEGRAKDFMQKQLRSTIKPGEIDVNIMTKVDRMNRDKDGELLPIEYSDALSAFRGFALSELSSSVVFSAGLNPRLYSYCESFNDFFPDANGNIKKKIILKVSDYRSALIQGKFLAKKGLWISEYRIESGLNCGGHAFATEGILLGPILEEFKEKRNEIRDELFQICNDALVKKNINVLREKPELRITVQGGIGTALEDAFLLKHFGMDGTGWGSPFLLVPEATNVDDETLQQLVSAKKDDYYLSHASPLGIPYNNFKKSSSEKQRLERINKDRPGSPCYKKFLAFDTEFKEEPICVASREYQHLKLKQLKEKNLPLEKLKQEETLIMEKECLCEGLTASVFLKDNIVPPHDLKAVSICPGPNLAYFSGVFSLKEMVNHIYGRINILNNLKRPNMFVNELNLYVDYWKKEIGQAIENISAKNIKHLSSFKANLLSGIDYYKGLLPKMNIETIAYIEKMRSDLLEAETIVRGIILPEPLTS